MRIAGDVDNGVIDDDGELLVSNPAVFKARTQTRPYDWRSTLDQICVDSRHRLFADHFNFPAGPHSCS
jgi:hypothetical protein